MLEREADAQQLLALIEPAPAFSKAAENKSKPPTQGEARRQQ
jgi:hypothetical protein